MTADNPSRVSGAAQQVEMRDGIYCVYGQCRGFPHGAFGCHPCCSFVMTAGQYPIMPAPNPIAVAERAVIDAAMEWHISDPYLTNSKKLRSRLAKLDALRTAPEPDPIAAAERAVINETVDWYPNKLEDAVRELLRLRAAREPKP